jgi:uroporphyrin-III C-methyltransferase
MTPAHATTTPALGHGVFVGAGPGAADLITLRGLKALQQAEVVLADALIDPELRAMAPTARWVDVGKRGFAASTAQARIHALLIDFALRGLRVVRLKGGDPSLFGRLEEELQAAHGAGISTEVVPGVTSALAAAAHSQRPLTRRGVGRTVSFTTAMTREGAPDAPPGPPAATDTAVFYMASKQLPQLARRLLAAGWAANTCVHVVSDAGSPRAIASTHRVEDLGAAAMLHAGRPSIVTVGVGATPVSPHEPRAQAPAARHPGTDVAQAAG